MQGNLRCQYTVSQQASMLTREADLAAQFTEAICRPTCDATYLSRVYQVRNLRTVDNLRTLR